MAKPTALNDMMRADHRFLMEMVDTFYKKKGFEATPEAFDKICEVFTRMGGSWEKLFRGSVEDIDKLKKIMKVASKVGVLKKTPKFR